MAIYIIVISENSYCWMIRGHLSHDTLVKFHAFEFQLVKVVYDTINISAESICNVGHPGMCFIAKLKS